MLYFTVLESRPVLHESLLLVFVTVTTPVTLMLLARAALFRNRAEGNPDVPPQTVTQNGGRARTNREGEEVAGGIRGE